MTARETFDTYNRFWHLKMIKTKSRQSLVLTQAIGLVVCVTVQSGRAAQVVSVGVIWEALIAMLKWFCEP